VIIIFDRAIDAYMLRSIGADHTQHVVVSRISVLADFP